MANTINKSPELNEHRAMDELAMRCLELLEEIIHHRSLLDEAMKNGFISMAQARYNMGKNSVSRLQLPTEDCNVEAQFTVTSDSSEGNPGLTEHKRFSVVSVTSTTDSCQVQQAVRQRNRENVVDRETDDKEAIDLKSKHRREKSKEKKNPLNWFGILVPNALRECQSGFQKSLFIIGDLATLQNELFETCKKFKELRNLENKLKDLDISKDN